MRAELFLLGKRINMASQTNRRFLVVSTYVFLAAVMVVLWMIDRWRSSGIYVLFATALMNKLFLGGYYFGGLIKPFNNHRPSRTEAANPLMWFLKANEPEPREEDYCNDERETEQRGVAHYRAYQVIAGTLVIIWLLAQWKLKTPRSLAWMAVYGDVLIYGCVLSACMLAITLPQAILLWTEPDMEPTD